MTTHENDDELTPEEREAFAALPRQRIPPAELEDRVVDALHGQGLLVQNRRLRSHRGWLATAAAAGALAIFSSGLAVGQWLAGQSTADVVTAVLEQDPVSRALAVQAAGSEYVRAVARLSDLMGSGDPRALDPGREAGAIALHAAALELARLSPDDPTIQMVLAVLEERMGAGAGQEGVVRQTIWF
jgi:hypothetical protein